MERINLPEAIDALNSARAAQQRIGLEPERREWYAEIETGILHALKIYGLQAVESRGQYVAIERAR